MDSGRAMINPQEIDLSELAVEVMERLEPLAREKAVELKAGDLPEVIILGDQQYLTQMLSNLVENAIKYSRPDGPFICLQTGKEPDGENGVGWIRVEDNGIGIPTEAIPHLFDRFYRVDTARSHEPDESGDGNVASGSGLGLAIVDWIVHAHGGKIQVASQPGQGSIFTVELPLAS